MLHFIANYMHGHAEILDLEVDDIPYDLVCRISVNKRPNITQSKLETVNLEAHTVTPLPIRQKSIKCRALPSRLSGKQTIVSSHPQDLLNAEMAITKLLKRKLKRTPQQFVDPVQQHEPDAMPLTLATQYTAESLATCNMQEQSPLFGKIPGEIRNLIFELATQPFDDPGNLYKVTDYWYRPGYHAKPQASTGLLLTCRRVWLETNSLPMRQAVPTFWFKDKERRPEWTRVDGFDNDESRFVTFMTSLTSKNLADLQRVRIFGQMHWLESLYRNWPRYNYTMQERRGILQRSTNNDEPTLAFNRWPPEVVFAIKHTDWWYWEDDEDLRMKDEWIERLLSSPTFQSAKTFKLELETLNGKRVDQLHAIMKRVMRKYTTVGTWKLQAGSGRQILAWTRPGNVDGKNVQAHRKLKQLNYQVFQISWNNELSESCRTW